MSASTSFEAQFAGTCARCHREIDSGELVRYVDDELVHFRHPVVEKESTFCLRCWLAVPCGCED